MFNFFSILLILFAVLQIVEAIEIWVKPSNLRYTAEIICLNSDGPIKIGQGKHYTIFDESNGYVNICTNLSKCDQRNSTVKVLITNLDRPSDSMEFEIPKAELSARKSAVVLAFNIEPRAYKIFYFQQSSSIFRYFQQSPLGVSQRPLVDYELEIECNYMPDFMMEYIVFGRGVQLNGQNRINIPIYETEKLAFCSQGRIGLNIYNAEHETTHINLTKEFFLENDAFKINMRNKTVQPILQNGRGN